MRFSTCFFSLIEPIWVPDKQTIMGFLKNFLKVCALVCIAHLWIRFCFTFPLRQGEACKDKIVPGKTPRSVSNFWIFGKFYCRLLAILACVESDSVKCLPVQSPTPRSVSQFCICEHLNFRLRAVLAYAESDSAQC